jgi:hypothetical protein
MRLLGEHGEGKPSELRDCFSEPIKRHALRSYLRSLHEKGHVFQRRVGRAYFELEWLSKDELLELEQLADASDPTPPSDGRSRK